MSLSDVRRFLFGRELATLDALHQALGRAVGLAVLCSDSLSSVG